MKNAKEDLSSSIFVLRSHVSPTMSSILSERISLLTSSTMVSGFLSHTRQQRVLPKPRTLEIAPAHSDGEGPRLGGRLKANHFALAAAVAFSIYTTFLIARMVWLLWFSTDNVIRADELFLMAELKRFHEGTSGLSYLWAPYWGHRPVIPRLFILADEHLFHLSDVPLVAVTVIAQCATAGCLLAAEWRLLRKNPLSVRIFALSATAQLALSSLQMENFSYGMGLQYTVGLLGAVTSIAFAANSVTATRRRALFSIASLAGAMICTLSIGSGLLLFPVIAFLAWGLRTRPRIVWAVLAVGLVLGAAYMIGYNNIGANLTFEQAFRNPDSTLKIASLILAGPFSNQSVELGECCGLAGILLLLPSLIRIVRRVASGAEGALAGICLFLILTSFSIALARISPEWFGSGKRAIVLPSRWLSISMLYWGAIFSLTLVAHRRLSIVTRAIAFAVVGCLTLYSVPTQLDVSIAWLNFHRTMDVAAAGLMTGVVDPTYMYSILPDQKILDFMLPYMRQHRISFFNDPEASWIGQSVGHVFSKVPRSYPGEIDSFVPLQGGGERIEGSLQYPGFPFAKNLLIVITDSAGRIDGLGFTLPRIGRRCTIQFLCTSNIADRVNSAWCSFQSHSMQYIDPSLAI